MRGAAAATRGKVRLVKGSHIVTRKFWSGDAAPICSRTTDRRVIFVNPYEGDFTLIGTTDIPFEGDADDVAIDRARGRISRARRSTANSRQPIDAATTSCDAFSGVRPLYDDNAGNPSAVTRDYVFDVDAPSGARAAAVACSAARSPPIASLPSTRWKN